MYYVCKDKKDRKRLKFPFIDRVQFIGLAHVP